MKVLIVAATHLEIEPLLLKLKFEEKIHTRLKRYSYENNIIHILITGIGMTTTAYWMGKTIASNNYDISLNIGLAGSFDQNIKIGEVVHVNSDQISELGAEDGNEFLPLAEMNLRLNEDQLPSEEILKNNKTRPNSVIDKLPKVKGVTVNTVHGNETSIEKVKQLFHPQVETMEGAAFFYACLTENIQCAQIRSISNKVEKRNKEHWNIPLAIKNLCSTALEIIDSL